jgi:hypothetical protein
MSSGFDGVPCGGDFLNVSGALYMGIWNIISPEEVFHLPVIVEYPSIVKEALEKSETFSPMSLRGGTLPTTSTGS